MTALSKIAWVFAFLNAITIFYISSLTFPIGPQSGPQSYLSIFYHFFAFFFLALFLLLALVKGEKSRVNYIFVVIVIAVLYGISDEIHQLFVPGRACEILDVIINSLGILTVSGIYALFLKWKN